MEISQSTTISKRLKIVYLVLALSGLMFISLQLPAIYAYWGVSLLVLASYVATILSLDLDLHREEWVVLPLYSLLAAIIFFTWTSPLVSTVSMALLASAGFGIMMYGMLLTLNIINLSTIRTIPLARPANTVLSFFGLAGGFAMFHISLSSQPNLLNWMLGVGGSTILLAWPLIWISQSNKLRFQSSVVWTIFTAVIMMQLAVLVAFWPISFLSSLVLAIALYLILGILHLQHKKQLNQEMKKQYLILGGVAVAIFMLFTQW